MFACESHSDAISTALGVLGGELEDVRSLEARRLIDNMFININSRKYERVYFK
jgi:hypothetical protein